MKRMVRKIQALILAVAMAVTGVLAGYVPSTDVDAAGKTTVIFHYNRSDGNYADWDVYTWVPDTEVNGAAKFTAEDNFGKIAVVDLAAEATQIGFIVRKGGDDWKAKDIEEDRMVSVTNGYVEVWITSEKAPFEIDPPEGCEKYDPTKVTESTDDKKDDVTADDKNDDTTSGDGTTVVVHYQRSGNDYDGWTVWGWPDGGDGKSYDFKYDDSFGKVAVIKLDSAASSVGFIIRYGDWEEKDYGDDRFIEVTDGKAEIWVTSGEEEFATSVPVGGEEFDLSKVEEDKPVVIEPTGEGTLVNLHYHRYDDVYDNWDVWFWPDGGEGTAVEFAGKDDFGMYAAYEFDSSVTKVGFIVRTTDWGQKDCDMDRFIDLTTAVDGVVDIWLVQSDPTIYTKMEDADLSPKFLGANLNSTKRISVSVTTPLDCSLDNAEANLKDFSVVDTDGNTYEIEEVVTSGAFSVTSEFYVNMKESLDLSKNYTLKSETYGEITISFAGVYSTSEFEEKYTYSGDDLGANWTKDSTTFKVWTPTATKVVLYLYDNGKDGDPIKTVEMTKADKGVWETTVEGDLNKTYYTYGITNNGVEKEAVDLYARTTGVNGKRGMVIDLDSTDPENWDKDEFVKTVNATDAMVYEMHIRDFTIDESSGVTNKGKYLGLTEKGTTNATGQSTALDYLAGLGITHVQMLPMYDYSPNSVNEDNLDKAQFNWGYDPYNYNVPEGSYSTDPYNGEVRVKEMKQMIQALHNENIGVIMDVVYNHTAESEGSYFNLTVPEYYHRMKAGGGYSNASGCGNEVASERAMVRKYIVDSVVYWASEYHIDGFRFDLMGILDIETMNAIRTALLEVNPSVIIYGEGWTGGDSALDASLRAMKINTKRFEGIGAFSDDIRDGIKGSVFDAADKGFATGKEGQEERIKAGVVGATDFPGIDWKATGTDVCAPWSGSPVQTINYVSAHDNLTLWDKINSSNPDDSDEVKVKMNKLAAGIYYTSQGIPFMLSGEEILRSKPKDNGKFDENSYKSPDSTNAIKWDTLNDATVTDVHDYYQGLMTFRKNHAGLRMATADEVAKNLTFLEVSDANVVAYVIDNHANGECSDKVCVIYNANANDVKVNVPEGDWKVCVKDGKAGNAPLEAFTGKEVTVPAISCTVMVQGDLEGTAPVDGESTDKDVDKAGKNGNTVIFIIIGVAAAIILGIIGFGVISSKKKKKKLDDALTEARENAKVVAKDTYKREVAMSATQAANETAEQAAKKASEAVGSTVETQTEAPTETPTEAPTETQTEASQIASETVQTTTEASVEPVIPVAKAKNEKLYEVELISAGLSPSSIAAQISSRTNITIEEAMELVDKTPVVIARGLTLDDAASLKAKLEVTGAVVELR